MDISTLSTVAALVVVVVGAVYVGRSRGKDVLIETQERQIAALRQELTDNERRSEDRILHLTRENAALTGRVGVLERQQASVMAAAIAPVVAEKVVEEIRRESGL